MPAENPTPAFVTVEELAELLRVNVKTIYQMIKTGTVPGVVHAGRALRLNREVVLAWLADGKRRDRRTRR